jgi:N-acetylneuraminic acid mutarotase
VSYENQVYAVGGATAQGTTNVLERYSPSENEWVSLSSKPTAVRDVGAAVVGGLIYVPGGRLASGEPTDTLEVYDPREDAWKTAASLPVALSGYALVAFEGKLYLFGGWDGETYRQDVYEYDPDNDAWISRAPMPSARAFAGASVASGKIFVMGGHDGREALRANEAYQPELDNGVDDPWEVRAPLEQGRYAMGVAGVADLIYLVGGVGPAGEAAASSLSYFPQTDSWQEIDNPEHIGSALGLVVLETRLYAVGGQVGDQPTGQTLEYQAIYTISIPVVRYWGSFDIRSLSDWNNSQICDFSSLNLK